VHEDIVYNEQHQLIIDIYNHDYITAGNIGYPERKRKYSKYITGIVLHQGMPPLLVFSPHCQLRYQCDYDDSV
jgi:hypothetical protein